MPKERICISIDENLVYEIQGYAKSNNISRSELIEEVLIQWQRNWKKQQMVEGYKAMAKENLKYAKTFALLGEEAWPDE